MALVLADRVRDTTTTTGTGAVTLSGSPPSGYQAFSKVGDGNTTYYTISGGGQWEVGIGTYTASSTSLSRDTVLDSSNSGSLVNFSSGTKDVFVTYPAGESVYQDGSTIKAGTSYLGVANGGTGAATLTSNALLKGNGTSAISASGITDNGTIVTIAEPVRLSTPNTSAAAWTTSGINLVQSAATFTDTSSTGTVTNVYMNSLGAQTVAASNPITISNLYGTNFSDPVAGTNVTASFKYAIRADSAFVAGLFTVTGSTYISPSGSGTITLFTNSGQIVVGNTNSTGTITLGQSTVSQTTNIQAGATASGSTKTVNIGTNGASDSTTNITVGSATSGATSTTVLNGNVGVGSTSTSVGFYNTKNITGATTAYANHTSATVQSDVTAAGYGYMTSLGTVAAAFTLNNLYHYRAYQNTFGAGSAVSNQTSFYSSTFNIGATANHAFVADDTSAVTTGKTAFGFRSYINIATGGGTTYQMYLGGTAQSVIGGKLQLGGINFSSSAWTTSGVGLIQAATTYTDTSTAASGTVATAYINRFNAQTYAATNTGVTVTNLYGTYFNDPAAGTNVTATNRWSAGADSLNVVGVFQCGNGNLFFGSTGQLSLVGPTATITHNIASAGTTSGNTKTLNIGTGGASGSTTAITLGSSTSGATQTTTINGRVTLAPIGASAAAWTTSGIALTQSAATWTDTSSTGTVSEVRMNNFAAQTAAASNTVTYSYLYGAYFNAPLAGTNVTANNRFALGADSLLVVGGFTANGTLSLTGPSGTNTANFAVATTGSGSTKTVNIGTGGASGSTTNITIGSSTSGATSTTRLNGTTIIQQAAPVSFSVSGTLTGANMATGFIQFTGSTGQTLTTDTGTNLDTALAAMAVDTAIDFSILNTGSVVSIAGGTGVTVVGRASVAANSAVLWRLRKTGTATYTLYQFAG